jgi:Domain of unknown function (DUF4129)
MRGLPGTSRTRPRAGRADRTAACRVAAVAILLALTAAGLRSRGTFSHAPDRALAGASGAVVATVLTVTEGVALVAFVLVLAMARPRRKPKADDEPPRLPFPWWAKTLAVLAAVAVMVTPFAVLLTRKTRPRTTAPQARAGVLAGGGATPPRLPAHGPSWPLLAGMLIALALLLTLTVWSRRTRRRATGPPRDHARLALGQSLAAGRAALAGPRDPRAAIIACYAAMERGFAAAGSAPAAADTPAEVLARATGAGLVRSGSAARMAGLFRRARYSFEPMTSADSAAAASALDQMQADLGPAGAAP